MKSVRFFILCRAAAAVMAVASSGAVHAESDLLTDKAGMTVYTFDKDSAGRSVCYGDCAAAWPPVAVGSIASGPKVGAIDRIDGIRQAAYEGRPLYLFAGDRKPGDINGDNIQNVWHVVPSRDGDAHSRPKPAPRPQDSAYNY